MKHVWMETMKAVWDLLEGYDGDVCFLEDDLVVAPDFFRCSHSGRSHVPL